MIKIMIFPYLMIINFYVKITPLFLPFEKNINNLAFRITDEKRTRRTSNTRTRRTAII